MRLTKLCVLTECEACVLFWKRKSQTYKEGVKTHDENGMLTSECFDYLMHTNRYQGQLAYGEGPFFEEWVLQGQDLTKACIYRDLHARFQTASH
jgi:hypothetical protein